MTADQQPDKYFEDYEPGCVVELGSIAVSEAEIVDFARLYDPQPFHTDPEAAAHGPFGGLIASGWQTCVLTATPRLRFTWQASRSRRRAGDAGRRSTGGMAGADLNGMDNQAA